MNGKTVCGKRRTGFRGAHARGRGGHTLVELTAVMSVNAVLMAVGVGLLGTLLRTEHQGRRHFERTSGLARMADQWRADVAASRNGVVVPGAQLAADAQRQAEPHPAPGNQVLRLRGARGREIEFFRDGDRMRRVEYEGPTSVRREAYSLRGLAEAEFSVSESQLATLRLEFGDDKKAAREVWRIEARLDRDGRFAGTEDSAGKAETRP